MIVVIVLLILVFSLIIILGVVWFGFNHSGWKKEKKEVKFISYQVRCELPSYV